jgi:hypothetical protein
VSDASTASLITAGASLIVALVAGGLTLRNGSKANKNAFDIQELKGAVDRDLERLKPSFHMVKRLAQLSGMLSSPRIRQFGNP